MDLAKLIRNAFFAMGSVFTSFWAIQFFIGEKYASIVTGVILLIIFIVSIPSFIQTLRDPKQDYELVILHSSLNYVSKSTLPEFIQNSKNIKYIEIELEKFNLYNRSIADWDGAVEYQKKIFQQIVKDAKSASKIHFFGTANVSMIIHLGYLFSLRYNVEVYQHIRIDDRNEWGWVQERKPKEWKYKLDGQFTLNRSTEMGLLMSVSKSIVESDVSKLGLNLSILHFKTTSPGIADIRSEIQVSLIVQETITNIEKLNSLDLLHLFAAIPPSVAFKLGQNISNTMKGKIQLYEFLATQTPKYAKSFILNS